MFYVPERHQVLEPNGHMSRPWLELFNQIAVTVSPSGGLAPANAQYLLAAVDAALASSRVAVTTATIAWDFTTIGQARVALVLGSVLDAYLRDSAALSVIGRAANSVGSPADIVAALSGQVLRRSGTALAFGALDLANSDAITGRLPYANLTAASAISVLLGRGAASGAGNWQEIQLGTGLTMTGTTLSSSSGTGTVTTTGSPTTGLLPMFSGATSITNADAAAVSSALDLLGT